MLEDGDGIELVQCYNPRSDVWSEKSPMLIPRSGSGACVLDGMIYIIGIQTCKGLKNECNCTGFSNLTNGSKKNLYMFREQYVYYRRCIFFSFYRNSKEVAMLHY